MVKRALNIGIVADYLLADAWFGTKGMIRLTQETALVPILRMKKNKMKYRLSEFVRSKTVSRELAIQALYQHCVRKAWNRFMDKSIKLKPSMSNLTWPRTKTLPIGLRCACYSFAVMPDRLKRLSASMIGRYF